RTIRHHHIDKREGGQSPQTQSAVDERALARRRRRNPSPDRTRERPDPRSGLDAAYRDQSEHPGPSTKRYGEECRGGGRVASRRLGYDRVAARPIERGHLSRGSAPVQGRIQQNNPGRDEGSGAGYCSGCFGRRWSGVDLYRDEEVCCRDGTESLGRRETAALQDRGAVAEYNRRKDTISRREDEAGRGPGQPGGVW